MRDMGRVGWLFGVMWKKRIEKQDSQRKSRRRQIVWKNYGKRRLPESTAVRIVFILFLLINMGLIGLVLGSPLPYLA